VGTHYEVLDKNTVAGLPRPTNRRKYVLVVTFFALAWILGGGLIYATRVVEKNREIWRKNRRFHRWQAELQKIERALIEKPNSPENLNSLAWYLATSAEDRIRDGDRAVQLATRACELSHYKEPMYVDTLAAAYAEAGDFENAVKYQTQAVEAYNGDFVDGFQKRLVAFKSGIPWREPLQ
jgi:tetratricopeptide (TPR) repeat protein